MSNRSWNPLIGLGYASLGIGFLWEVAKNMKGQPSGIDGLGAMQPNGMRGVQSVKQFPAGDISQREDYIISQMKKDAVSPEVVTLATALTSGKCPTERGGLRWCVEIRNYDDVARVLFDAVVNPNSPAAVRYTPDHRTVDMFRSSALMSRIPAGDCDDMVIRLGALYLAHGFGVKTRIVAPKGQPGRWSHIYLVICPPHATGPWRPVDPTEPEKTRARTRKYPYWEIEDAYVDSKRRDRIVES